MTAMFRESDEFRLPGFLLGIIVAGIALFGEYVVHVFLMSVVLLLYRRLGYRLHRCNRAGMTAAMNAAPLS
jgi:hypothetical protein